ncbi:MAG: hypothetical protein M0006_17505 [Magnetospirillum sp.]|nr:hypothetical protein [Magnetospirillum sp.]
MVLPVKTNDLFPWAAPRPRVARLPGAAALFAAILFGASPPAEAADDGTDGDYLSQWFDRVDKTQAEQPHWMTPMVTVTPRLEEEVRYDQNWQRLPHNGATLTNFDGGKGLELIPAERVEVLINAPPYQDRSWNGKTSPQVNGFGDWPFLTVKYRIAAENEQNGNYIVTAFLGASAPTGNDAFTNHQYVVTPTIAAGKGWGNFDVQSTLSYNVLTGRGASVAPVAPAVASNTAFQYHLGQYFWPEFEVNYSYWYEGERVGLHQVLLTPGVIVGRFPIYGRLKLVAGLGYQIAVTPTMPTYRNNLIATVRVPF